MEKTPELVTIVGPTASGKTTLAAHLAYHLHRHGQEAEILSGDSRQVYRRMDIGTGKDLADYVVEGYHVRHHLIDICEPGTRYNLFEYQRDFLNAYTGVLERGAKPILCGGTGLYIESVLGGYHLSPVPQNQQLRDQLEGHTLEELTQLLRDLKRRNNSAMHNQTDVDTAQRAIRAIEIETYNLEHPTSGRDFPKISSLIVGVDIPRDLRREKITRRLHQRLDEGMADEVRQLLDSGLTAEDLIYYGLEYRFVTEYVVGRLKFDEMFRQLEIAIHQFAKRQMTWFRGMERRGFVINWIDATWPTEEKIKKIEEWRTRRNGE